MAMAIKSTSIPGQRPVARNNDIHLGHGEEENVPCECKRMLCGLVGYEAIHSTCPYHGSRWNNTMTEWHYAKDCFGFEIDYTVGVSDE